MAEQPIPIHCPRCAKALKSKKEIPVGAMVRCPVCGERFRVDAVAGTAPAPAHSGGSPPLPGSTEFAYGHSGDTTHAIEPKSSSQLTPTPQSWMQRPPLPGAPEVAGYTILDEVGRGATGVVYKARHERLKRVVALKMIAVDPREGAYFLAHFQAEAEAVARLHHPNIIQIYEVGEQGGRPYLALEFATGGTLRGRLNAQPQPIRASAQLLEVLARTIHAAHQRGIVHRDLKPANILLEPSSFGDERDETRGDHFEAGQLYGTPKITDFGVAKRIDDDSHPTRYGEVVGTPRYMAPEQVKGSVEEVGPGTDVYALGAILYEMLTGRPPFFAQSNMAILSQVGSDEAPTPPRQLRRTLPRDLDAICRRCLEKEPRRRYRSALALAEDLRRFLDGEPILARPAGPATRLWSWSLRNPIPASLLLTATVVLAFGSWSVSRLSDRMVRQTALESAAQQTQVLREMNRLYTDVAAQAKKAGVEVTHRFPDDEKPTIPIPARFTILLGERVEQQAEEEDDRGGRSFMRLQMYSKYPFRERVGSPPKHRFGIDALAYYETAQDKTEPFYRFDKYNGLNVLRYATPMIMTEKCITCHNDKARYPKLGKTDWKVGDVRGVLEIIRPLDESIEQTRQTLFGTYAALGIMAASLLAASWISLKLGRRRGRQ